MPRKKSRRLAAVCVSAAICLSSVGVAFGDTLPLPLPGGIGLPSLPSLPGGGQLPLPIPSGGGLIPGGVLPIPPAPVLGSVVTQSAYVFGYPDDTFQANNHVTRAEATAMFIRLLFGDNDQTIHADPVVQSLVAPFIDIQDSWAKDYIVKAFAAGIINGVDATHFDPNAPVKRDQYAKILGSVLQVRLQNSSGGTGSTGSSSSPLPFPDIIGNFAQNFITLLQQQGVVTGYPDGTFNPDGYLSRAEIVTETNKFFQRLPVVPVTNPTFKDEQATDWWAGEVESAASSGTFQRFPQGNGQNSNPFQQLLSTVTTGLSASAGGAGN